MPERTLDSPQRRRVIAGVGAGLTAYGTGIGSTAASQQDGVTVTLDNVGASAWEVTNIDGGEGVAETGVENPTLTLREGVRYTVVNDGWSAHPLAFRGPDDEALLSQSEEGTFEDTMEVDWVDNEEEVSFTVTGNLADELDHYVCTVHSPMEGTIETVAQDDGPAAAVEFSDQSTDGTSVTVDSARLDDGGFVTIHDSSLLDGETIPSVVGVSGYLGPGANEDVEVTFDEEMSEDDTLIAMPHRDTNGNETYDFVETGGDEDGPYTFDGGAVIDDAEVSVLGDATVTFSAQDSDGSSVVVDSVSLDDGGFVTIHDSSLQDGEVLQSVVGVSEYLGPGEYDDVEVSFDEELTEDDTLIAMPHRDTNGNETYDFVETEGAEDGPYLDDNGDAVVDDAAVTVADGMDDGDMGDDADDGGMDDGGDDESMDDSGGDGSADDTDGEGPGFGPVAGVAGLGGLAAYAYRKLGLDSEPPTPDDDGEETDE